MCVAFFFGDKKATGTGVGTVFCTRSVPNFLYTMTILRWLQSGGGILELIIGVKLASLGVRSRNQGFMFRCFARQFWWRLLRPLL